MLTFLLGPDDFSKYEYVSSLGLKAKILPEFFSDAENAPSHENLVTQDLFGSPKIFVLKGLIAKYNEPEVLEKFIDSKNQIVLIEEKLDKRNSQNKALLANKKITIKEFILPHGQNLDKWIINRVKELRGNISAKAAGELAKSLGRDNSKETRFGGRVVAVEEVFNLWQADSEIRKLVAYAEQRDINEADVKELSSDNMEIDIFDLTNAIADGDKKRTFKLMRDFLRNETGSDEKTAIIKLNALLSEQFRSYLMIQDFTATKKPEVEILELTGWKSGRLFVLKKIAQRFNSKLIKETLNKLAALDEELKTGSVPPKVLLDLIITQLFISDVERAATLVASEPRS